jgi:diguanylate cyclase
MTILISFISLACQLLRKKEISNTISNKLAGGTIIGVLGILLILFSVPIGSNTLIDFRNVIIALAAIHLGAIITIISGLIIMIFRLFYFGISLYSIMGCLVVVLAVLGDCLIARLNIKISYKWIFATLFNLITSSIIICFMIKGLVGIPHFLFIYISSTCAVSTIVYYYSDYCLTANQLFRKLLVESTKDFLTGLNNVRSFDTNFNTAIINANEKGEKLSLLMIDIDFFKKVNDTYGHGDGDIVLRELGKILVKTSRSFDIVSRNGGEEFTVLLLDCSKDQALEIAERIRSKVQKHSFVLSNEIQISITVSVGVSSYPESLSEIEKLLETADMALYTAKRTGRNRVCLNETTYQDFMSNI